MTCVAGLACLMLICNAVWTFAVIPPTALTRTSIGETFYRIHLYAVAFGRLPESLELLPIRAGYWNSVHDAWGAPLAYEVHADGLVTLRSLGADGEAGGTGVDADQSRSYRWLDEQGQFCANGDMWIVHDEVR
jgi:hypothetical protein